MPWWVKGKLAKVSSSNQKMSGKRGNDKEEEYEVISKQERETSGR